MTSPVEDRISQFEDRSIRNIENKCLYREKVITDRKEYKKSRIQ